MHITCLLCMKLNTNRYYAFQHHLKRPLINLTALQVHDQLIAAQQYRYLRINTGFFALRYTASEMLLCVSE